MSLKKTSTPLALSIVAFCTSGLSVILFILFSCNRSCMEFGQADMSEYRMAADYSEYWRTSDKSLSVGEAVVIDTDNPCSVRRASLSDAYRFVGVVSQFGTRNNDNKSGNRREDPDYVNVGLVGQLPVLVTLENGPIKPGDPLTISSNRQGKATKATGDCVIIGYALTHYPYLEGEITYLNNGETSGIDIMEYVIVYVAGQIANNPSTKSTTQVTSDFTKSEVEPSFPFDLCHKAQDYAMKGDNVGCSDEFLRCIGSCSLEDSPRLQVRLASFFVGIGQIIEAESLLSKIDEKSLPEGERHYLETVRFQVKRAKAAIAPPDAIPDGQK